jgi:phosphate transport system substrate-binding protein
MAYSRGRCTNFDYCTLADRRQDIEVKLGDSFQCPECGAALKAPPVGKGNAATQAVLAAGVAAALLASGVWAGVTWLAPATAPQIVAKTPAAPRAQPQAAATVATPVRAAAALPIAAPAKPAATVPPETILLRLSGSNTIGATLGPQLARAFLANTGDTNVAILPSGKPDEVRVTGQHGDSRDVITVAAHGSATAFTDLAAGAADVGMASRRIKSAEKESLAKLGDMTAGSNEHVLALDGIAVVVHPANAIQALNKEQLRDIFSGATKNWVQLGGAAGDIHVLARDDKSGTFDTFKALVLGAAKISPEAKRIEDSRELSARVAADPNAIGFIGLPYILDARAVPVADTGATPLLANRLTVGTEDYPLARRLYLYTAAQSDNPMVRRFTDFALSPPGQAIVEDNGFVALTIKPEAAPVPQTASAKYRSLIGKATRLSTNFRFEANSVVLDNRAQRDLDRLVNYVVSAHANASQIILVGFADNKGSPTANLTVSKKRAEAVAAGLAQRGLKISHVAAFGADLPVADNSSDDGREKNRRVEVYVQLGV